ncbi:MAG: response regulator transcription factor [Cytophagales bacterium]|nr:response regulator transcription factor [Cytophagales bacterium]
MQSDSPVLVALVDDHKLFRKGMVELINGFSGFSVRWEANNGRELTRLLQPGYLPDIVLLDINMPEMDGYETAAWLQGHYPQIKVLALSMYDKEEAIIKMLKSGARGYILKDADPADLRGALTDLVRKGFHYSDLVSGTLMSSINRGNEPAPAGAVTLTKREVEFLKLACTELTYKEIADRMDVSLRAVDGYREDLFKKLNVKNRVGLVMYAVKHDIVKVA